MVSRRLAAMQPHFLPWVGFFELMRLSDVFVHLDDLSFPQGRSLMNRVRISAQDSEKWITAPIASDTRRSKISAVRFDDSDWRESHLRSWTVGYRNCPNFAEQFALAQEIYANQSQRLVDFNVGAIELMAAQQGVSRPTLLSSSLKVESESSERLIEICLKTGADEYLTGHGAFNYLDHALFEANGIRVSYIAYRWQVDPGSYPARNPFHSCIANLGYSNSFQVTTVGRSETIPWREFDPNIHGFLPANE